MTCIAARAPAPDNLNPIVEDRGRGRVLLDEVLPLQFGPKLRRDRRLHGAHIGEDLRLGMRADDQRGGDVGRRRELERSRSQIGAELSRHSDRDAAQEACRR